MHRRNITPLLFGVYVVPEPSCVHRTGFPWRGGPVSSQCCSGSSCIQSCKLRGSLPMPLASTIKRDCIRDFYSTGKHTVNKLLILLEWSIIILLHLFNDQNQAFRQRNQNSDIRIYIFMSMGSIFSLLSAAQLQWCRWSNVEQSPGKTAPPVWASVSGWNGHLTTKDKTQSCISEFSPKSLCQPHLETI